MGIADLCAKCTSLTNAELKPIGHAAASDDTRHHYLAVRNTEALQALSKKEMKVQNAIRAGSMWTHAMDHPKPEQRLSNGRPLKYQQTLDSTAALNDSGPTLALVYSRADIQKSAKAGCHLCAMMLRVCNRNPLSLRRRLLASLIRTTFPIIPVFFTWNLENARSTHLYFLDLQDASKFPPEQSLGLYLVQSTLLLKPITQDIPAYLNGLVSTNSVHPQTVQRIKLWLDNCRSGRHDSCNKLSQLITSGPFAQPRRLIEIRREGSRYLLRLVETDLVSKRNERIEFTALSHCWGEQGISCKLVTRKQATYSESIPWKVLPRTFRDAVDFTSLLELQYIWIDALCIIQDSEKDWNEEAPRMAAIYSSAVVCLAASSSQDPEGGLYTRDLSLTPCPTDVSWLRPSEVPHRIAVLPAESIGHFRLQDEPLQRRAWTYQERQLSLRTIIFALDQLWWTCPGKSYAELNCGNDRREDYVVFDPVAERELMTRDLRENMILSHLLFTQPHVWVRWTAVVEQYSSKTLSHSKDRLVAIAGVAQIYTQLRKVAGADNTGRYLAGLWDDGHLLENLLWLSNESVPRIKRSDHEVYIAPTWSWASINRKVFWDHRIGKPSYNLNARILASSVSTVTGDPYGPVTSGEITLRSPLQLLDVLESDHEIKAVTMDGHRLKRGPGAPNEHNIWRAGFGTTVEDRYPATEKADFELFAPLARRESIYRRPVEMAGLLLSRVKSLKGVYRRIGVMTLYKGSIHCDFSPSFELIWERSAQELAKDQFLENHGDGTYTIKII